MKTIKTLPRKVRETPHTFITLPDGTKLAARMWMPEDADKHPVPAILEYLPYRKRDGTHVRDALTHPYLAGHGYACVRVDMRGNGDSDGLMLDEYTQQEMDDACDVIAWLVAQQWCTGKVGMMGISWGGFNALQMAALRPPGFDAVITLCSTDDRYSSSWRCLLRPLSSVRSGLRAWSCLTLKRVAVFGPAVATFESGNGGPIFELLQTIFHPKLTHVLARRFGANALL